MSRTPKHDGERSFNSTTSQSGSVVSSPAVRIAMQRKRCPESGILLSTDRWLRPHSDACPTRFCFCALPSDIDFNFGVFVKQFLYHIWFPVSLPFILLLEGRTMAHNQVRRSAFAAVSNIDRIAISA